VLLDSHEWVDEFAYRR